MVIKQFEQVPIPNKKKYKVCFYSNSPNSRTGFSKVIRSIGIILSKDPNFEVHCIGENYDGQPVSFLGMTIWGIHPENRTDQRTYFPAIMQSLKKINPDVIIILEDSFTLGHQNWYDWALRERLPCPIIYYLPLDGGICPSNGIPILRMVDKIISMAKYTQQEAKKDGFDSDVIWHGVDPFIFKPVNDFKKRELRKKYGIPEDCFLIMNYGRNSLRKNNPTLLISLAKYFKDKDPNKYKAFLHINQFRLHDLDLIQTLCRNVVQEVGYNPLETGHIILNPKASDDNIFVEDWEIAEYIQMSDVAVSCSSGEGFGFINVESPSCQVPVITTGFTTTEELLIEEINGIGPRGISVPYDAIVIHSFGTKHAYVNVDKMVEAIDYLEKNPEIRKMMGQNGRKFVTEFANWDYLVEQWKQVIYEICN